MLAALLLALNRGTTVDLPGCRAEGRCHSPEVGTEAYLGEEWQHPQGKAGTSPLEFIIDRACEVVIRRTGRVSATSNAPDVRGDRAEAVEAPSAKAALRAGVAVATGRLASDTEVAPARGGYRANSPFVAGRRADEIQINGARARGSRSSLFVETGTRVDIAAGNSMAGEANAPDVITASNPSDAELLVILRALRRNRVVGLSDKRR